MRSRILAVLVIVAALGLSGCNSAPSKPGSSAKPTSSTPAVAPARLEGDKGFSYRSCGVRPGLRLLQAPITSTGAVQVLAVNVLGGNAVRRQAWVARTPAGAPPLVATVDWPGGLSAKERKTYAFAARVPADGAHLAKGTYHLFVVVSLQKLGSVQGLQLPWKSASGHSTLTVPLSTTPEKC